MTEHKHIHVGFAFDQNFLIPFYVLLTSLFDNNKEVNIYFHIIATGLNDKETNNLTSYIESHNAKVTFYTIDLELLNNMVLPEHMHFSVATYYRLLFPDLVYPTIEKLLYIDTDTVITGSLFELYNSNVDNFPVGAVLEKKTENREDLGLKSGEYFNAGVLLINIPQWKSQKITERAINFIVENPEKIKFVDQDALNFILYKNWALLDERFNVTFYDIPFDLKKREFKIFLRDKVIIHYTTQNKPWLITCRNRFRYLYHHYLKISPCRKKERYFDVSLHTVLVYFKILIKEFLIDYVGLDLIKRPLHL